MTLGEKIKYLRMNEKITQEELAERLNVSRSAIAKWEADKGIPEISNLKMIAHMFGTSIDELLDNAEGKKISDLKNIGDDKECAEYIGFYCDIELDSWNDGAFNVIIIGEDKDFVFYKKKVKKKKIKEKYLYGLILKKRIIYIKTISKCEELELKSLEFDGRNYFCMKNVCLELASKEGIIKGFFDFRNDDYMDVCIKSFTDKTVSLRFGKEINVDEISKIEEL